MTFAVPSVDALGGDLGFSVFGSDAQNGRLVTVRGGAVVQGEILRMCTDSTEGVTTTDVLGPNSPQQNYEKLTSGASDSDIFDHAAVYAVALEAGADNEKVRVCDCGIVRANVDLTDGVKLYGLPLVADFAAGDLIEASASTISNGKICALLAEQIADGDAAGVTQAWVMFSGVFPLGVANITAG